MGLLEFFGAIGEMFWLLVRVSWWLDVKARLTWVHASNLFHVSRAHGRRDEHWAHELSDLRTATETGSKRYIAIQNPAYLKTTWAIQNRLRLKGSLDFILYLNFVLLTFNACWKYFIKCYPYLAVLHFVTRSILQDFYGWIYICLYYCAFMTL